ncbi:MAG: hypothetical protein P4L82_11895 [Ancalomicrobiaceae bacterium]|nr:hypothetical protein [Ancalomicrobiaceae bacterium]
MAVYLDPTRIDETHLIERLAEIGPNVREKLARELGGIVDGMVADARQRAQAHIRFLGAKKPGSYVASITGGVAQKRKSRVTGFVRSGHPLAHLMELGFQITDMEIAASAASVMAFEGDAGMVFATHVHRHATTVQPYPAILPAFEAKKGEIAATLQNVARQPEGN